MSDATRPVLFLSRAQLRDDASVAALTPLLLPTTEPGRSSASHRLIWSLMTDSSERTRDFLWREDRAGKFMILSQRPPGANLGLFTVETTEFTPNLRAGDKLHFVLRVNATGAHRAAQGSGSRGKRHDVIMHALYALPREQRAASRQRIVQEAVAAWLADQGNGSGFTLSALVADGYRQLKLVRSTDHKHNEPMVISTVECEGELTVADPQLFLSKLSKGFGRARAYGCGLMLIRRG